MSRFEPKIDIDYSRVDDQDALVIFERLKKFFDTGISFTAFYNEVIPVGVATGSPPPNDTSPGRYIYTISNGIVLGFTGRFELNPPSTSASISTYGNIPYDHTVATSNDSKFRSFTYKDRIELLNYNQDKQIIFSGILFYLKATI